MPQTEHTYCFEIQSIEDDFFVRTTKLDRLLAHLDRSLVVLRTFATCIELLLTPDGQSCLRQLVDSTKEICIVAALGGSSL